MAGGRAGGWAGGRSRVREDAGHSLKSSLKHVWTAGTEDDALLPRQGVQVQLSHELAGLGGNVNFIKHEALARLSALLPLDMVRVHPAPNLVFLTRR